MLQLTMRVLMLLLAAAFGVATEEAVGAPVPLISSVNPADVGPSPVYLGGQLVDQWNKPIPGADLHIREAFNRSIQAYGVTDGEGRFISPPLPDGNYMLRCRIGHLSIGDDLTTQVRLASHPTIAEAQDILRVPLGGHVIVQLFDETGKQVEIGDGVGWSMDVRNKTVTETRGPNMLSGHPFPSAGAYVMGVQNGIFFVRFGPAMFPRKMEYFAWHEMQIKDIEKGPAPVLRLTLREPTAKLRGTITQTDGKPAVKAECRLRMQPEESPFGFRIDNDRTIRTDEQGRFALEQVLPGDYALLGPGPQHDPAFRETFTLAANEDRTLSLTLAAKSASDFVTVTGQVREPSGLPVPEVFVEIGNQLSPPQRSDAQGNWSFQLERKKMGRFTMGYSIYTYTHPEYLKVTQHVEDSPTVPPAPNITLRKGRRARLQLIPVARLKPTAVDAKATDTTRIRAHLQILDAEGNQYGNPNGLSLSQASLFPGQPIFHSIDLPTSVPLTIQHWYYTDPEEPVQWYENDKLIATGSFTLPADSPHQYTVRVPTFVEPKDSFASFAVHMKCIEFGSRRPAGKMWASLQIPQNVKPIYPLPDGNVKFEFFLGASRMYFNNVVPVSVSKGRIDEEEDLYFDEDPKSTPEDPVILEVLPIIEGKKVDLHFTYAGGESMNVPVYATVEELPLVSNTDGNMRIYHTGADKVQVPIGLVKGKSEVISLAPGAPSSSMSIVHAPNGETLLEIDFTKITKNRSEDAEIIFPERTAPGSTVRKLREIIEAPVRLP